MSNEIWLPRLTTKTPQQGFELAILMANMGQHSNQTNAEILEDAHTSQVIAIHFQTIAAANNYWR